MQKIALTALGKALPWHDFLSASCQLHGKFVVVACRDTSSMKIGANKIRPKRLGATVHRCATHWTRGNAALWRQHILYYSFIAAISPPSSCETAAAEGFSSTRCNRQGSQAKLENAEKSCMSNWRKIRYICEEKMVLIRRLQGSNDWGAQVQKKCSIRKIQHRLIGFTTRWHY